MFKFRGSRLQVWNSPLAALFIAGNFVLYKSERIATGGGVRNHIYIYLKNPLTGGKPSTILTKAPYRAIINALELIVMRLGNQIYFTYDNKNDLYNEAFRCTQIHTSLRMVKQ
jgi:hypothetical protein